VAGFMAIEAGARGLVGNVPVQNRQGILATFRNLHSNPYTNQTDQDLKDDIKALKEQFPSSDDRILDRQEVLAARGEARTLLAQANALKAAAAALNQAAASLPPAAGAAAAAVAQALDAQAVALQAAGQQLAIESGLKNS
jgi:hypothetical protein